MRMLVARALQFVEKTGNRVAVDSLQELAQTLVGTNTDRIRRFE